MRSHSGWLGIVPLLASITLASGCERDRVAAVVAPDEVGSRPAFSLEARTSAASASGTRTSEHVFVMNSTIPNGFGNAVTGAGGSVVYSIASIGVVVTTGLTDAAAQRLARGKAQVERDVSLRWVPTPAAVGASSIEYDGAGVQAHNPATAAFFLTDQWNMRQIEAHNAWTAGAQAPGVRVAILDTGLDDKHLDQAGLIDMAASVAFTPSVSPVPGPPWRDDHFHGTHVGGIVVANGIGVSGVAPHATLIAVKVLDATGNGSFGNIIAGIIYATDVGADVINMSLGATFPKSGSGQLVAALNKAINYAHRHDVVVVSAAGNDNEDLQHNGNRISVPCESGVGMCISATGPTQAKASYSNYGSSAIHVAAPGGEGAAVGRGNFVLSPCSTYSVVIPPCRRNTPDAPFRYLYVAGTSQAAPHVSGVAALLRAQGYQQASQIITTIEDTSDDLGKPGTDQVYGRGRINAFRAWTDF